MGYNSGGWYGASFGKGKTNPENLHELSEKDVMNVLDIVRKDFNDRPGSHYLMGHSMGGGGTWQLGIKYPDQWAALCRWRRPSTGRRPTSRRSSTSR